MDLLTVYKIGVLLITICSLGGLVNDKELSPMFFYFIVAIVLVVSGIAIISVT